MSEDIKLKQKDIETRNYYGDLKFGEKIAYTSRRAVEETPTYLKSFFPIFSWFPRYNRKWALCDMIAGVTVGVFIVPQSMAYVKLANLPLVYGLYTSFMGAMLYAFMGTSREISVGPTAILSLVVGSSVSRILADGSKFRDVDIAVTMAFIGGIITFLMGIFRLGILLDLIPNPAIVGFTTGSAFTILVGQTGTLLGIPNIVYNDSNITKIYKIFTNISNLNWRDLVFGLSSLTFIFTLNFISKRLEKRRPAFKFLKFASNGLAILIFTIISFLAIRADPKFSLKIVKEVPRGFNYVGVPNLDPKLLNEIALGLIPVVLVGVVEQVALCKAFAHKSGYQISSSQELFALGVCNFFGSFFSAYPATGAFARTAVKSQCGVRTPLAGMWTGTIALMALGFLTPAFYYIPNSTLSAMIIVSASNLISSYKVVLDLWRVQPTDCLVFILAVLATFFGGSEIGIASSVGFAFLILLYHITRPKLYLLSQVLNRKDVFIDSRHPGYKTISPIPGVLIFKPQESLIFTNIGFIRDSLLDSVLELTKSAAPPPLDKGDKLWSDDLESRGVKLRAIRQKKTNSQVLDTNQLPFLKAIVFDFGSVNLIDSSGLQGLFEIREMLLRHAGFLNTQEPATKSTKNADKSTTASSLIFNEHNPFFEIHFVSTNPKLVKIIESSGITSPITHTHLSHENNKDDESQLIEEGVLDDYIEPIASNASRFVHLTVSDAIESLKLQLGTKPTN